MADAVHYLCAMDSVNLPPTPALFSGCEGFPFVIDYGTPTAAQPVAVPLEEHTNTSASIARWYYRVKRWQLSTDFKVVNTNPDTYTLSGGALVTGTNNPLQELNTIITPGGGGTARDFNFKQSVNGGTATVSGTITIIGNGGHLITKNGTDFFSNLALGLSLDSVNFSFIDSGGLPSVSGQLDGISVPIYYDNTNPTFDTFTGNVFNLTPLEFWPYAAKDGSPIYDTTTGAVLQDPRN